MLEDNAFEVFTPTSCGAARSSPLTVNTQRLYKDLKDEVYIRLLQLLLGRVSIPFQRPHFCLEKRIHLGDLT